MKKLLFTCAIVFSSFCLNATTFYFDADKGNDENDGRSPQTAWKSLEQIPKTKAKPGDSILFKRGCLWRGRFNLISGEPGKPVTFGNYGEGPLPIIEDSIAQDKPADWFEWKPGIWATCPPTFGKDIPLSDNDMRTAHWACYVEKGAQAICTNLGAEHGWVIANLKVLKAGNSPIHIQWWGPYFTDFERELTIKLRARSKRTIKFGEINILQERAPWRPYARGTITDYITPEWKEYSLHLKKVSAEASCPFPARLHINLGNILKDGDEIDIELLSAQTDEIIGGGQPFVHDIGNIIFDHGQKPCARKRWGVDKLEKDFDFFHDHELAQIFMKAPANPATLFKSIELAQHRGCIIGHGGIHDAVVDGLAIRYGAAHGFGGGNSKNITIRNCDIYYIGGALQYMRDGKYPVRYGNGIEFWGNCDGNLVENNRVWEIYDAALTNQGRNDTETNITYRNNVIWNAEFSFEYWNMKLTDNILFENNTCINGGGGWAHFHRPDPNGAHLMFYGNRAKTTNFVVRNNIFAYTTEQGMRMDVVWIDTITLQHNLWFTGNKPVYHFYPGNKTKQRRISMSDMKKASVEFHQDETSIFAEPVFVNPAQRDYRLAPNSPGFGQGFGVVQNAK